MLRNFATGICALLLPSAVAASGIAKSTCEDTGAQTVSMLNDRQDDRFVYFVEADLRHGGNLDIAHSRSVLADCKAGWQIAVPSSDDRAVSLMHDAFYGEKAYGRRAILDLMQASGAEVSSGPFDREHCTCKVDPSGDTHLVDG